MRFGIWMRCYILGQATAIWCSFFGGGGGHEVFHRVMKLLIHISSPVIKH